MILLALMLLAPPAPVALLDELVRVPPAAWRAFDVTLKQRGALIDCRYAVERNHPAVRVALMKRADSERFEAGRNHRSIITLPYDSSGVFRHPLVEPGEYRLVIDNRKEERVPAIVRVQLVAVFGDPSLDIRELPPLARTRIVIVSLCLFGLVVLWTTWRIRRASLRKDAEHD